MAAPDNPTLEEILREGLLDAGAINLLPRAESFWMEEIKQDIADRAGRMGYTQLKSLQEEAIQIGVVNQRKYDLPSDYSEEFSVILLSGDDTGTAQAGASTTMTLDSSDTVTQAEAEGSMYVITGGTGVNGYRQCISYDTATFIATFDSAWDTTPDATSTYMRIESFKEIGESHILDMDALVNPTTVAKPSEFFKFKDEIYFNKSFDVAYPILIRYFMDINQVNLTEGSSTLITKLYRKWRGVLTQGLKYRAYKAKAPPNQEFPTWKSEYQLYEKQLDNLIARELPSGGEFEGFSV